MMKKRILLMLSLILVATNSVFAQTARKTLTNLDLEKYRQERLKSEAEYRANYKKLGMPSPEELEQQRGESRVQALEKLRQLTIQNAQDENYFQARANQLRAEIIGIEAQINYLSGQIGGLPNRNSVFLNPSDVFAVGVLPYRYNQPNRGYRRQTNVIQAPNVQTAINAAAAAPNPYVGTPLYRTGIKATVRPVNPIGRGAYRRPHFYGGYSAVPYAVNNNSNEREELISRLRYLEQTKAGLLAQFDSLQEEARRAGVRIN